MLHTIFGHKLYIKEFKDLGKFESYKKIFTKQIVNMVYNTESTYAKNLLKRGNLTTSVYQEENFKRVIGYQLLEKVLQPAIIEARGLLFEEMKISNFRLRRSWHNINYKNSYVESHAHTPKSWLTNDNISENTNYEMLVCVFYLEAPENSGKLAIINDKTWNMLPLDFEQDKVHYITVKPNMLVCHKHDLLHAVSEHLSDDRRICIIFEYLFEYNLE